MHSREALPFKKNIKWGGQELDSSFNELDFLDKDKGQKDQEKNELKVSPNKIEDSTNPPLK